MFPLIKEKNPETGLISDMRLAVDKDSYKKLDYDEDLENDSKPFHSFYITSEEFGPNTDSYAEVSDRYLNIYDSQLKMKREYEGLNIRSCQDVHQGYLYTISDEIA